MSVEAVYASGKIMPLDSLEQTFAYNADGTLDTITVSFLGDTYVQTCTYNAGRLIGISAWVKQ